MATTDYPVNHPLAVKHWGRKLFHEALADTYFSKFSGEGTDVLCQIRPELNKAAGDRIRVGLRVHLNGDGVAGDGTLEGNEEALSTFYDDLLIDQLRHAVRSGGKMSEQRVPFSVREEAKMGLKDWWRDRLDTAFFNQLCGYLPANADIRYTGMQPVIAASADRIVRPASVANDEGLSTGNPFTLSILDKCVELAETTSPIIRPFTINGEKKFVAFLHPYQVTDLRTNTNTGQWLDIEKAAMAGGRVSKNPIYTGALGEYNGVILHKALRIPQGVHSSSGAAVSGTRRAVFCGAQAMLMGYGQRTKGVSDMEWVEEKFDYGNQLGVAAGMIFGMKKTVFNSKDFGTIVMATSAAAH